VPVLDWLHALWLVTILAGALTVARLYRLGLHRVYRFFFWYLALRTLRSGVLLFLRSWPAAYGWAWVLTQPLVWVLYVLIVLELYSLAFKDFRGIYTVSRRLMAGALGLAVCISALSFLATRANPVERYPVILYYTLIERGIDLSLVVFLFILAGFLVWYPVPLSRNALAHTMVYCVFFLSDTAALLIRNVLGTQVNRSVNTGILAISSLCVLLWLFLFTREGETRKAALRHRVPPEEALRLIEQLRELNTSLSRSARH